MDFDESRALSRSGNQYSTAAILHVCGNIGERVFRVKRKACFRDNSRYGRIHLISSLFPTIVVLIYYLEGHRLVEEKRHGARG